MILENSVCNKNRKYVKRNSVQNIFVHWNVMQQEMLTLNKTKTSFRRERKHTVKLFIFKLHFHFYDSISLWIIQPSYSVCKIWLSNIKCNRVHPTIMFYIIFNLLYSRLRYFTPDKAARDRGNQIHFLSYVSYFVIKTVFLRKPFYNVLKEI